MPNGLRSKLSKLRFQGKITQDEYKELIEKLEGHDEALVAQIKWERDTAIEQLKQLGYGLGEKIEPCDDCVSRQAAIEVIYDKYYDNAIAHDIVGMLFDLPSVSPQQRWIPVSERLPKSLEDVLATDGVDMFVAFVREKTKGKYEWYSLDVNYDKNTPIEAWMPLPEPYKAEMEGDND